MKNTNLKMYKEFLQEMGKANVSDLQMSQVENIIKLLEIDGYIAHYESQDDCIVLDSIEKRLYLIHGVNMEFTENPIHEILTFDEFEKLPENRFDEYWRGVEYTVITCFEDLEKYDLFCTTREDRNKIIDFFEE